MTSIDERIPDKIKRLPEIAYNLWWSWNPDARELFKRLDLALWKKNEHNPVRLLHEIRQEDLEYAARSALFMRHYDKVIIELDRELANGHTWYKQEHSDLSDRTIAYFSAEFGIHQSLPIYSGGLGILSGDHAKESSDLGIPLVGVGFMYPQGYFRQQVPSHGWQEAVYEQLDLAQAPIRPVLDPDGHEMTVKTRMGDHEVFARVWHVQVGRISLYLLDTDVDENDPWDR
ncbi:MAG: DUF3417 domain-containing protein, partial [Candidatus Promineifilaceae bacterium]